LLDSSYIPTGTKSTNNTKVNVTATGNVYLEEKDGNLNLEKLITAGDSWIKIDNGSLIDANKYAERDERTYEELLNGVWSDLQLTAGTGASTKISDTLASMAAVKTQEYKTYWTYTNSLDGSGKVTLSTVETDYYTDYYTNLGTEQHLTGTALTTFVQNALATLLTS
jgi:hypothetical protein